MSRTLQCFWTMAKRPCSCMHLYDEDLVGARRSPVASEGDPGDSRWKSDRHHHGSRRHRTFAYVPATAALETNLQVGVGKLTDWFVVSLHRMLWTFASVELCTSQRHPHRLEALNELRSVDCARASVRVVLRVCNFSHWASASAPSPHRRARSCQLAAAPGAAAWPPRSHSLRSMTS